MPEARADRRTRSLRSLRSMSGSRGALAPEPEPIDLRSRPHRSPSVAVFEQDSDGEQHATTSAITAAGDLQLEVEESPRWQANEKFQVQDGDASADQEGERAALTESRGPRIGSLGSPSSLRLDRSRRTSPSFAERKKRGVSFSTSPSMFTSFDHFDDSKMNVKMSPLASRQNRIGSDSVITHAISTEQSQHEMVRMPDCRGMPDTTPGSFTRECDTSSRRRAFDV